jgi:peptide/nickel transport system permease protein
MFAYLIKRILLAVGILFAVMVLLILVVHLVPGNPALNILTQRATPELVAQVETEMNLDKPIHTQIWLFVSGAVHGDLGTQFQTNVPVRTLVFSALPDTLALAMASLFLSVAVGIPLGVAAAVHPDGWLDRCIRALSMFLLAGLPYVIALILMLIFCVRLDWLPAVGAGVMSDPLDYGMRLILPAIALALPWWGYLARFVRSSMLEVMSSDYIRTARAFGFRRGVIFYKCALRNAMVPVVALFGLMFGMSVAATLFAEQIFTRPGLGTLSLQAIDNRDWPVIRATVLVYGTFFVFGGLLSDLALRLVDSRIRVEELQESPV